MIVGAIKCNGCGKMKGEANHWRLAQIAVGMIMFLEWNDKVAKLPSVIHLCGDECAHKELSKFLGRPEPAKN